MEILLDDGHIKDTLPTCITAKEKMDGEIVGIESTAFGAEVDFQPKNRLR
jgi:hypothetical protein